MKDDCLNFWSRHRIEFLPNWRQQRNLKEKLETKKFHRNIKDEVQLDDFLINVKKNVSWNMSSLTTTPRSDTWYAEFLSIQYFAKSPILLSFFKNVLTDINIFMNVLQGRKYRHLYQYFANSFLSICQGFGYAWVADPSVNNFFFIWFSFLISFWSKTYISTRSTLMPQAVVASSSTIWENTDLDNVETYLVEGPWPQKILKPFISSNRSVIRYDALHQDPEGKPLWCSLSPWHTTTTVAPNHIYMINATKSSPG